MDQPINLRNPSTDISLAIIPSMILKIASDVGDQYAQQTIVQFISPLYKVEQLVWWRKKESSVVEVGRVVVSLPTHSGQLGFLSEMAASSAMSEGAGIDSGVEKSTRETGGTVNGEH